jgi:hypothetical protein
MPMRRTRSLRRPMRRQGRQERLEHHFGGEQAAFQFSESRGSSARRRDVRPPRRASSEVPSVRAGPAEFG